MVGKITKAFPALLLVVVGCFGGAAEVADPETTVLSSVVESTSVAETTPVVESTLVAAAETTTSVVVDTSPVASPTTTTSAPPEVSSSDGNLDDFTPRVIPIGESLATTVASSWQVDCPVPLEELRLVQVRYWKFNETTALGWLVVHVDVADDIGRVFEALYAADFPIQQIQLVDVFDNDDDLSMEANNTSAFNCRTVSGSSNWSEHAYGRAVDINPRLNPFVTSSGNVFPPEGAQYVDRTIDVPGLIIADGAVVDAFASIGWEWGGNWSGSKDYQHFSENGR